MTDPNAWDLMDDSEPDSLEAADPMVFIHYRELYLEDVDTLIFDNALMCKGVINARKERTRRESA
jgi:hypothetical protein